MKTIKIEMSDTIYSRLKAAGTKAYSSEVPNPDYDPQVEKSPIMILNTDQTREEYLEEVVEEAIKQILRLHEVNKAAREAEKTKVEEIDRLNITSTIL